MASLRQQLEKLNVGDSLLTTQVRTGIYTAAKRAGIQIKTEIVEGQTLVTRTDESTPVQEALERVSRLSKEDRLEVFASFELCCGMNRGSCICVDESQREAIQEIVGTMRRDPFVAFEPASHAFPDDPLQAFIAKAQAKKGIVPDTAIPVSPDIATIDDWRFAPKEPTMWPDDGKCYRKQLLWPLCKRSRIVEVDPDDQERILRVK